MFTVKRYFKQFEMMSKDSVKKFVGTRIGRLVGQNPAKFDKTDRHFFSRLDETFDKGLTRDEFTIREESGLFVRLRDAVESGAAHVASFVTDVEEILDGMRDEILASGLQQRTIYKVRTKILLE